MYFSSMEKEWCFMLFMIFITSQVFAICDLNVTLLNQEPYPAIPGENLKVVFQVDNSGQDCNDVKVSLIENYPFTLDPSSKSSYLVTPNNYVKDYNNVFMAPFTVRIDKDAIDGNATLEIQYGVAVKKFNIQVDDIRSDFEVFVENYNVLTNQITFEILNIAGNSADAITLEIPEQDGVQIMGSNKQNIGGLSSNDDTTADFKLTTDNKKLLLNIYYSDSTNTRRIVEKEVEFKKNNFIVQPEKKFSFVSLILPLVVIGIIVLIIIKRRKKNHKKI